MGLSLSRYFSLSPRFALKPISSVRKRKVPPGAKESDSHSTPRLSATAQPAPGGGARGAPLLPRARAGRAVRAAPGERRPRPAAGGARRGPAPGAPEGCSSPPPRQLYPFSEGGPHARPGRASGGRRPRSDPHPEGGWIPAALPARPQPCPHPARGPPPGSAAPRPPPARPASLRPRRAAPAPTVHGERAAGVPAGPGRRGRARAAGSAPPPPGAAPTPGPRPPPVSVPVPAAAGAPRPAAPRRPGARLPQAVAGGGVGCISPGYIAAPGCGEGSGMRNRLGCQRHTSGRAGGGAGPRGGERRAGVGPAGGTGTPGTPGTPAPPAPPRRCPPTRAVPRPGPCCPAWCRPPRAPSGMKRSRDEAEGLTAPRPRCFGPRSPAHPGGRRHCRRMSGGDEGAAVGPGPSR